MDVKLGRLWGTYTYVGLIKQIDNRLCYGAYIWDQDQ